jgi:REP element-mobilizing transposase RayT
MDFLEANPSPRLSGCYDRGYLPHVRAQGQSYFVTFRLEGTLPQEVLRQFQAEREALLAKLASDRDDGQLSPDALQRLFELFAEKIEAYLDAGRGECWLKQERIAHLVAAALKFFHGQRYDLGPWVVMPNHVHAIVRPLGAQLLDEILKSWKGFTGREANKLLNRSGQPFWAREYYDHVVRNDAARARLADYIHDNPVKAGLCARWEDWQWGSAYRL